MAPAAAASSPKITSDCNGGRAIAPVSGGCTGGEVAASNSRENSAHPSGRWSGSLFKADIITSLMLEESTAAVAVVIPAFP